MGGGSVPDGRAGSVRGRGDVRPERAGDRPRDPDGAAGGVPRRRLGLAAARGIGAGRRGAVLRWLRTGAVTAVLLVVFGSLLASADAVFATLIPDLDLGELPGRLVLGALGALAALAVVSLAIAPPAWSDATVGAPTPARRGEWFVPVLALATLMASFLLTQLVTLIGGDDYVRSTAGLTYASYARQGFGQLVAVTALTLLVVAWFAVRARAAAPTTPGAPERRSARCARPRSASSASRWVGCRCTSPPTG